jgi:hypothetical protein
MVVHTYHHISLKNGGQKKQKKKAQGQQLNVCLGLIGRMILILLTILPDKSTMSPSFAGIAPFPTILSKSPDMVDTSVEVSPGCMLSSVYPLMFGVCYVVNV